MVSCTTYDVIILLSFKATAPLTPTYFYNIFLIVSLYINYFKIYYIILKIQQNVYKVDLFKKALLVTVVGNTNIYIFYVQKISCKIFSTMCKFKATLNGGIENMASCFLSYFYASYHAVRKFSILVRIYFYFITIGRIF